MSTRSPRDTKPAEWEAIGFDLWDAIAAIAQKQPRQAAAVAKAALYTVQTEIEKGTTSMPTTIRKAAPDKAATMKRVATLQPLRNQLEIEGAMVAADLASKLIVQLMLDAGVASEAPLPDQQLDDLKRLAATENNPVHRAHYQGQVDFEVAKRAVQASSGKAGRR